MHVSVSKVNSKIPRFTCNLILLKKEKLHYPPSIFRGVLPLGQRARLWEKHRARSRKQQRGHSSNTPQDLQAGQSVTMKNAPMYQPGAIGNLKKKFNHF